LVSEIEGRINIEGKVLRFFEHMKKKAAQEVVVRDV
jgi:hypothetical protein